MIRVWNRAAERLPGYTAAQAIGQRVHLIVVERLREAHRAGFDGAVERGAFASPEPAVRPSRAQLANGETLVVDLTAELIRDEAGSVVAVMSIIRPRPPRPA